MAPSDGAPLTERHQPMTTNYDGMLAGLANDNGAWSYEGASYSTPATEGDVRSVVDEALCEPDDKTVAAAAKLVFGSPGITYTSQALIAIAAAYGNECEGGEGVEAVLAVLRDAARRIAVIESLTI